MKKLLPYVLAAVAIAGTVLGYKSFQDSKFDDIGIIVGQRIVEHQDLDHVYIISIANKPGDEPREFAIRGTEEQTINLLETLASYERVGIYLDGNKSLFLGNHNDLLRYAKAGGVYITENPNEKPWNYSHMI